jgi:cell wall-associated NlpC family hydrolase
LVKKILIFIFFTYLLSTLFFIIPINKVIASENQIFEGNKIPSYLKPGDILFCDVKPKIVDKLKNIGIDSLININGFSNDHCAMYIGYNRFIESAPYRFNIFKMKIIGVVISPFWKIKLWATNFTYAYVNTSQKIRNDAVDWAKTLLGQPYQFLGGYANPNPSDPSDGKSNYWYCSELIWASYWNQNFKLIIDYGYYQHNASSILYLKDANQVVWYDNNPPVVDIGGPFEGFVNQSIYFNAKNCSDTDGYILKYNWSFGDGSYDTYKNSDHEYSKPGNYTLKLTVQDNGGMLSTDSTIVNIYKHNNPPSRPIITGESNGYKNQLINFNICSNDPDNDKIKYIIDWGDKSQNTSIFLNSGEKFNISHKWIKADSYKINVYSTDGKLNSSNRYFYIYINQIPIDKGWVISLSTFIQLLIIFGIIIIISIIYIKKYK